MNDRAATAPRDVLHPLLEAARAVEARLEGALEELGLSKAKLVALTRLREAGEPLALSELALRCSCVRSNITQLVDRLESDGLVRRIADPDDRRSVRAELTAEGRRREEAGARIQARVESEVAAALPDHVVAALSALAAWRV